MDRLSRHRGCLLGLACGDAIGTTVEFRPRGSFPPVTEMVGGGPFRLPIGAWTDDTSMALCLAASLVECGRFDALDQMERYWKWYAEGYFSSTGECFDIGNTTRDALLRFRQTGEPWAGSTHARSAGNGCLMRLAPVPMFYHADRSTAMQWAGESSRTTHGAAECIEASQLLAAMLQAALTGASKDEVLAAADPGRFESPKVRAIAAGDYRQKDEQAISGSGYVVDCLEAAAWCFAQSDDFRQAVLRAVNLGDDADTTGAVCGQLAGAYFGDGAIPREWRERLILGAEIRTLAERLASGAQQETA